MVASAFDYLHQHSTSLVQFFRLCGAYGAA